MNFWKFKLTKKEIYYLMIFLKVLSGVVLFLIIVENAEIFALIKSPLLYVLFVILIGIFLLKIKLKA